MKVLLIDYRYLILINNITTSILYNNEDNVYYPRNFKRSSQPHYSNVTTPPLI